MEKSLTGCHRRSSYLLLLFIVFISRGYAQINFCSSHGVPSYLSFCQIPNSKILPISPIETNYNGNVVTGKFLTVLGPNNNTVLKPFFIIEGFDANGEQYIPSHIVQYNQLIDSVQFLGYDVIILDFDNATDYIQNNAMLLVKLIQQTASTYNLQESNFAVLGFSMGGLVARYALTWMESKHLNHHTNVFIAYDTPNKGANFPLAVQELIELGANNTSILWIAPLALIMGFNSTPAARQMLVYYFSNSNQGIARPDDYKYDFFNELYNLSPETNGYPKEPLKLAISNGNAQGTLQSGIQEGDDILNVYHEKIRPIKHYSWPFCGLWDFDGCYKDEPDDVVSLVAKAGFSSTDVVLADYDLLLLDPLGSLGPLSYVVNGTGQSIFLPDNYAYDNVPGSYSEGWMQTIKDNIIDLQPSRPVHVETQTTFIPTISALDLNIGLSEAFDENNVDCLTPFDYVMTSPSNVDHVLVSRDHVKFIADHLRKKSSPKNKITFSQYDYTIPTGTIVPATNTYDKNAQNKIENEGVYVVEDDAHSELIAGQDIVLKPGFSAEYGSDFSAKLAQVTCAGGIQFRPHHINAHNLTPLPFPPPPPSGAEEGVFSCYNQEEIPNYDPDVTYFEDCASDSGIAAMPTQEELDAYFQDKITIFPNPTNGSFQVSISEQIEVNFITVTVYDDNMQQLYTISTDDISIPIPIDVQQANTGFLHVNVNFSHGKYIYEETIMKN